MAYRVSIKKSCVNCGGVATVEVFNNKTASYGFFCDRCGERRIKQIEVVEKARSWGMTRRGSLNIFEKAIDVMKRSERKKTATEEFDEAMEDLRGLLEKFEKAGMVRSAAAVRLAMGHVKLARDLAGK